MPSSTVFFYTLTPALITSSHLRQGPPVLHPEVSTGDLAHPLEQEYWPETSPADPPSPSFPGQPVAQPVLECVQCVIERHIIPLPGVDRTVAYAGKAVEMWVQRKGSMASGKQLPSPSRYWDQLV